MAGPQYTCVKTQKTFEPHVLGLFSAKVCWPLRVNTLKTIFFKEFLRKPRINKHLNYKSHHVEQIGFLFINSKEAENKPNPKGAKWTQLFTTFSCIPFFFLSINPSIFNYVAHKYGPCMSAQLTSGVQCQGLLTASPALQSQSHGCTYGIFFFFFENNNN